MVGEILSWEGENFSEELKIYKEGVTYSVSFNSEGIRLFKHFEEIEFSENFSKLFEMDDIDSEWLFWKLRENFRNEDKNELNDLIESLSIIYENQGLEEMLGAWEIYEKTGLDIFIAAATLGEE